MRDELREMAVTIEGVAHWLEQLKLSDGTTGMGWSPANRAEAAARVIRQAITIIGELDEAITAEESGRRWLQLDRHLTEEETQMILRARKASK